MKFMPLPLEGAYRVDSAPNEDERGSFTRLWDEAEFLSRGLVANVEQTSLSHNRVRGTLRGLHYQVAPNEEAKLVTCLRGSIWDVVVDLRRESSTFLKWHAEVLDGDPIQAVYVPPRFAHGYLTLTDNALILYQISARFDPQTYRRLRWNDPLVSIEWPEPPALIGVADRDVPDSSVERLQRRDG